MSHSLEKRIEAKSSLHESTKMVQLLQKQEKFDDCYYEGRTLLHLAAMEGDLESVQILIANGANINATDIFGDQPLKIAMMYGHASVAKYLRGAGARLTADACADLGHRLCRFAAQGDLARVKSLIDTGTLINSCDYDGRTSLHLAAAHGHLHLVEYLISQGVDVLKKDRLGRDAIADASLANNSASSSSLKETLRVAQEHAQRIRCLNMDAVDDLTTCQSPIVGDRIPDQSHWSESVSSAFCIEDGLINLVAYLTAKASQVESALSWSNGSLAQGNCKESFEHKSEILETSSSSIPCSSNVLHAPRCQDEAVRQRPLAGSGSTSALQDDYAFMSLADEPDDQLLGNLFPVSGQQTTNSNADLGSLASAGSAGSLRLRNYAAPGATVLVMDIKGFTAGCAAMSAAEVGEWVAEFYSRVDGVAAAHGVRKAEVRGDCCICVAGTAASVPWAELRRAARGASPGPAAEADGRWDQVTRMLAFAADVHAALATLTCAGGATSVRMGMATGDLSLLVGDGGAGGGFVSVQGEAVRLATRMESQSEPGTVLAHRSALDKWVAEGAGAAAGAGGARAAPKTVQVDCGGGDGLMEEAAAYDFAARGFRRPAPSVPLALLRFSGLGARPSEPEAKRRPRPRSRSIW